MKHFLRLRFLFLFLLPLSLQAQLPNGSTAPNWTATDINGNSHTLYDYLDQGYTVALDFSATWCGPCWNYHNTHILANFYNQYGPGGTDEVMVFFIEADPGTNVACLYGPSGCVGGTQGNWVNGTPYPIIDDATGSMNNAYNIFYFPTLYVVCPDRKIYEVGQASLSSWVNRIASCSLDAAYEVTDLDCYGSSTGSIDLLPSGGYGALTYQWDNGSTTQDLLAIPAGTYNVTVTEGLGHSIEIENIDVAGPANPLTIQNPQINHINCNGENNGSIAVAASGGTPGYQYNWSNGQTGANINNLASGNYTVTITDANLCTETASYNVQEPSALLLILAPVSDICGEGVGAIYSQGFGGVPGYTFDIGNGPTPDPLFNFLSEGVYTVTITDNNGCTTEETTYVFNEPPPTADAGADQSITCLQPNTQLDGSGSSQGNFIQYAWSTTDGNIVSGGNTSTPTVDADGTYNLVVTDQSTGCTAESSVSVTSNIDLPTADAGDGNTLDCNVNLITLDGSGSSQGMDYSYLWTTNNGNITSGETSLTPDIDAPGIYEIEVTNSLNGCTSTSTVEIFQDTLSPVAQISSPDELTCTLTEINLDGTGSSQGVDFTYLWTTTNGNIVSGESTLNPLVDAGGQYDLLVTNVQNGCVQISSIDVTENNVPPTADAGPGGQIDCTNATLDLSGSTNAANADILWTTNNGNIVSGEATLNPTVDLGGEYNLAVVNLDNGCQAQSSVTISLNTTPPGISIVPPGVLDCQTSLITLDGSGSAQGTNISYLWTTDVGNIVAGADTEMADVDEGGNYTLEITDSQNGCTSSQTVFVEDIGAVEGNLDNQVNVNCSGASTGEATVSASGGTGTYTYAWSNGGTSATITNLTMGTYTATITDQGGCSDQVQVTITEPDPLTTSVAVTNESAVNANDGSATVSPSGGTPNYTYNWSSGGTTETEENLSPGTYTVTITDQNNCQTVETIVIEAFGCALSLDLQTTGTTCAGLSDGQATVVVANGTGPYTYTWSTGGSTETELNLPEGLHQVEIGDASGCSTILDVEITSPDAVTIEVTTVLNPSCPGDETGQITVVAQGGTGDLSYTWSNGEDGPSIEDLGAGTYDVEVMDENGCTETSSASIIEPDPIEIEEEILTAIDCAGNETGVVNVSAIGGTGDYNYIWSTGATTATVEDLGAGTYTVTATDENNCEQNYSFDLNEPAALILATSNIIDALCAGGLGEISVSADGGTGNYQFNWSDGSQGSTVDLLAGTYTLEILDDNGCTITEEFTVGAPDPVQVSIDEIIHVSCAGDEDGTITVSGQGGTGDIIFTWPSGNTGPTETDLAPGTYSVEATDENNCTSSEIFTIGIEDLEPPVVITQDITLNLDAFGQATLTPAMIDDGSFDNCGIVSSNVTPFVFDCSQAGVQTVILSISDGTNTSEGIAQVTIQDNIPPEVLNCPGDIQSIDCSGLVIYDAVTATDNCAVTGIELVQGLGSGATFPIGSTQEVYEITDEAGNITTCSFEITINNTLETQTTPEQAACPDDNNGVATTTPSGGTGPFTYAWDSGESTATAIMLTSGIHILTVTDATGCTSIDSVLIQENPAIQITVDQIVDETNNQANGAIDISVSGGTPGYSYNWYLNGIWITDVEDPTNLAAGEYYVEITDDLGCVITSTIIEVGMITGVLELSQFDAMGYFPNPTEGLLMGTLPSGIVVQEPFITIYDSKGAIIQIMEVPIQQKGIQLDLSAHPEGVYFIKTKVSGKHYLDRIILQR